MNIKGTCFFINFFNFRTAVSMLSSESSETEKRVPNVGYYCYD